MSLKINSSFFLTWAESVGEAVYVVGSLAYTIDHGNISATGRVLTRADIHHVATGVRAILRDDKGVQEARDALAELPKTEFETERLEQVLAAPDSFDEWRVGEALAEEHLSRDEGCEFPWPDSRSTRNPNSSGGGVDLVGFHTGDRVRFIFAEVKTSHQEAWPPALLTSRSHGLHTQLSGLLAEDDRSKWAIRYLMMNSMGKPWLSKLKAAMSSYLADGMDVVVFGVLVHATEPDQADLRARASSLAQYVSEPTSMGLIAIYLSSDLLTQVAAASVKLETVA